MSNPYSYTEGTSNRRANRGSYMKPANPGQYGQIPTQDTSSNYHPNTDQYNNANIDPNAQSHMYQQQQQQQQQQQNNQFQQFFQDPRAQVAYKFGQHAFNNFFQPGTQNNGAGDANMNNVDGQSQMNQSSNPVQIAHNLANNTSFLQLAYYFQVSNIYVFNKVKIIVVPFINKTWYRIQEDQSSVSTSSSSASSSSLISFLPPRLDVNCPDMYIPVMGMITYILGWNLEQGLKGNYDPQNLYYKLSSTLAFVLLDLFILKLGLYLIIPAAIQNRQMHGGPGSAKNSISKTASSSSSGSLVELLCFVGYKFVPLTFVLLMRQSLIFHSATVSTVIKVYLFLAFGVFLLRSVKFNLLFPLIEHQTTVNLDRKNTIKKCNYFLFFYGFIWQVLLMWLMG